MSSFYQRILAGVVLELQAKYEDNFDNDDVIKKRKDKDTNQSEVNTTPHECQQQIMVNTTDNLVNQKLVIPRVMKVIEEWNWENLAKTTKTSDTRRPGWWVANRKETREISEQNILMKPTEEARRSLVSFPNKTESLPTVKF